MLLSVSENAVYLRMGRYGISQVRFSRITDEDLDNVVEEMTREFPSCRKGMLRYIRADGEIKVQRMTLRDSIHRIDQEGVENMKSGHLRRRTYNVQGANHLWHIDTSISKGQQQHTRMYYESRSDYLD